ncbi:MAG: hypothetical protein A2Z06_02230 [Candidatus Glassbacteria bacterium RBG_16_58_8]|uniref:Inositol-1-monophosphatase n=1 Tax=Candidatus Glassbacteria bacterium RBG_16_58_8 TaxID=1817866 RepID=A0A1F5YBZ6_9BACT|nr:MAG: hypothetical protein A2Z06_02230 [Candidatus Glassbacteria bacterium RBG_16_58_8]
MEKTRAVVRETVLEAGEAIRRKFGKRVEIDFKGAIDLVTEVDRRSEEIIVSALRKAFPRDDILAEEGGSRKGGGSDRIWLVDPLDGTTNFAHGYPFISISVALEAAGEIRYGVVYDPLRDEYFEAEKGEGSSLNGRPIRVSEADDLRACLFSTGFPYDIQEHPEGHMEPLVRILMASQGIRRDGSAALDLCYVACGRFDGFYERKLAPWDTAAGVRIGEEAGGKVTSFGGGAYSIHDKEILATNGRIHEAAVKILTA